MHRPKRLKMAKPAALAMAEASLIPLDASLRAHDRPRLPALPADAARRARRRRGRLAQAARARRLHPPGDGRRLDVPAARLARAPEGRPDHPRGDGRDRRPGDADAGPDAVRALAAVRTRLHPGDLPAQGPQRPRLRAADDARGDGHLPRQGDPELPAAPADPLPLLDQGARRAQAARRAAADARVHHEGRVLVRPRRGGARRQLPQARGRLRPHLRALRAGGATRCRPSRG